LKLSAMMLHRVEQERGIGVSPIDRTKTSTDAVVLIGDVHVSDRRTNADQDGLCIRSPQWGIAVKLRRGMPSAKLSAALQERESAWLFRATGRKR
jgi:hypothetical protein